MIPYLELVTALQDWRARKGLPTTSSTTQLVPLPNHIPALPIESTATPESEPIPLDLPTATHDLSQKQDPVTVNIDQAGQEVLQNQMDEFDVSEYAYTEVAAQDVEDVDDELIADSIELEPTRQSDFDEEATAISSGSQPVADMDIFDEPTRTVGAVIEYPIDEDSDLN